MREYRVALEAFTVTGAPRIIATARSDVLTILRERRNGALGTEPSNWEFIERFVGEVRREDQSGDADEATQSEANWLAAFREFRELTNILRSTLAISGPLPRVAMLETV